MESRVRPSTTKWRSTGNGNVVLASTAFIPGQVAATASWAACVCPRRADRDLGSAGAPGYIAEPRNTRAKQHRGGDQSHTGVTAHAPHSADHAGNFNRARDSA